MNTFENFRQDKSNQASMIAFKELSREEPSFYMLLCYGNVGSGKTHLLEALANEFESQDRRAVVREWSEQVRKFKKAMRSNINGLYDEMFDNLRNSKILLIDDIGQGSSGSSWEWGELEDIVNYRYKRELITVLTTNLDIKDLPTRVISRFRDAVTSRVVYNESEDYRPKKVRE